VEKPLNERLTPLQLIHSSLQKLIGLHRQLLEVCRSEREALTQADLKRIEETTLAKQGVVEEIRQAEGRRIQHVAELAMLWKKPIRELSLPSLIIAIQGQDPKAAEQLRSAYNALTVLIQRITEQNDDNKALVQRSLSNVNEMKRNVLGEAVPKSNTYTAQGQRAGVTGGARLISKEV
jgi:flagellar biosynthesis/type III secretory pathway chaperone